MQNYIFLTLTNKANGTHDEMWKGWFSYISILRSESRKGGGIRSWAVNHQIIRDRSPRRAARTRTGCARDIRPDLWQHDRSGWKFNSPERMVEYRGTEQSRRSRGIEFWRILYALYMHEYTVRARMIAYRRLLATCARCVCHPTEEIFNSIIYDKHGHTICIRAYTQIFKHQIYDIYIFLIIFRQIFSVFKFHIVYVSDHLFSTIFVALLSIRRYKYN